MKLPGWTGTVLHAVGGAALCWLAALIGIPVLLSVPVIAVGGWLREVAQHDLQLSLHQWIEAAGWLVGALGLALWWTFG